jgi:membrane protein YdbS with pleckstrin-like domain
MRKPATAPVGQVETASLPALERAPLAALNVLRGDEIIELCLRPSHWYIAMISARPAGAALLLAAAAAWVTWGNWSSPAALIVAALLVLGAGRVLVASLQWASKLYVLTNRRVLRFSGVFNVHLVECPLSRVATCGLALGPYSRVLSVGTVETSPTSEHFAAVRWEHVNQPEQVLAAVERAVRRSRNGDQ